MITIPDVIPKLREFMLKPENGVGGNLHIVLEDGNVSDGDVVFCINNAIERGDKDGEELARMLLKMSKTQRKKLSAKMYTEELKG